MSGTLRVPYIGEVGPLHIANSTFLKKHGCVLVPVTGYLELSALLKSEAFEIVVLHNTLSVDEVREVGQLVRRRRPSARILMIRKDAWNVDDVLYDHRLGPEAKPDLLLATIEHLIGRSIESLPQERCRITKPFGADEVSSDRIRFKPRISKRQA